MQGGGSVASVPIRSATVLPTSVETKQRRENAAGPQFIFSSHFLEGRGPSLRLVQHTNAP